ncbi:hypothetical protein [Paenibacillus sp. NPDC058174]|uniref:hypothetical protein n=1 Tax=Paenibacillus sp. NPDC058174 TaxID=3346366 RepID=UPI0036DA26DB
MAQRWLQAYVVRHPAALKAYAAAALLDAAQPMRFTIANSQSCRRMRPLRLSGKDHDFSSIEDGQHTEKGPVLLCSDEASGYPVVL